MATVVESWWNGRHGRMAQQRARLCYDQDRDSWSIERLLSWGKQTTVQCRDEAHARQLLTEILDDQDRDRWRRVDDLYRRDRRSTPPATTSPSE